MTIQLEDLPNEIILKLFVYFDISNLYRSFWGINQRFNILLRSLNNLSLNITKDESSLIEIFSHQITHLKVETKASIDFTQCSNLKSLELCQATLFQLQQIQAEQMPNLINLFLHTESFIFFPLETICEIFSPNFHSLRQVHLNRLDIFHMSHKLQSFSLHTLHITCTHSNVIIQLLLACPNLSCFHVTFYGRNHHILPPSSPTYDHPLEKFTLNDSFYSLSYDTIQILLFYIPNVKYFYLNFFCRVPFITLMQNIFQKLEHLKRFKCNIFESPNNQMIDVEIIQQINECLHDLECIEQNDSSRLFLLD